MAKKIEWIPEAEAARKARRAPITLRRLVKKGTWNVSYRTINGKSYEYDSIAIERQLNKEAVII